MGNSNDLLEPKVVGGDGVKRRGLKERVKGEKVGERVKRERVEKVEENVLIK